MATSSIKTSLEAIPILKGQQNYNTWSQQMQNHLKASNAWEIITGEWKRPSKPSHFEAPLRPQDLIAEHRARRQEQEEAQEEDDEATPLPPYVPLNLRDAKDELEYIKAHIEQWNRWNKAERTAINDINSRLSDICKQELGQFDDLKTVWEDLKSLYVGTTCGNWVTELNTMVKLIGARKIGEDPNEWMRKVLTTGKLAKKNLGELSWDIFMAYVLTVNLGDDLTATTTETHRQSSWPSVDSLRISIAQEYQTKLNATGKTKPTATARPDHEPNLNLTTSRQPSRKRSGTRMSSPSKKERRNSLPLCPLCNKKHPIRQEGDCYLSKPETASAAWREKNKDAIKAFKRKKEKEKKES